MDYLSQVSYSLFNYVYSEPGTGKFHSFPFRAEHLEMKMETEELCERDLKHIPVQLVVQPALFLHGVDRTSYERPYCSVAMSVCVDHFWELVELSSSSATDGETNVTDSEGSSK